MENILLVVLCLSEREEESYNKSNFDKSHNFLISMRSMLCYVSNALDLTMKPFILLRASQYFDVRSCMYIKIIYL